MNILLKNMCFHYVCGIHARKDPWENLSTKVWNIPQPVGFPLPYCKFQNSAINHREHKQTWPDHFNPKSNTTEYVLSLTVCPDVNAGPSKRVMNPFSSAGGEHSWHSNHTDTPVHTNTKQKPGIWLLHILCHLTAEDELIAWFQNSSHCNKPSGFRL